MSKYLYLAFAAATMASACGTGDVDGCNLQGGPTPEARCQERESKLPTPEIAFKMTCEAAQAEYIDGPCPDAGKVLGCQVLDDTAQKIVDWYYSPKTRDEATMECADENGTVIEP